MIWPVQDKQRGIPFTLFAHTNREYGSTLAQERGKLHTLFFNFLAQCQKPAPPAPEFSALKQRGGAQTKIRMATW